MRALVTLALAATGCQPIMPTTKHHTPDANESSPDASSAGDPMMDGAASMTPTLFLDGLETKHCAAAFACKSNYPTNTGTTFNEAFGQNPSDCKAIEASYDMPATVETQVQQGNIHWDAISAQTCLSSWAYSCPTFWDTGATYTGTSCQNALVGSVADGGNCLTSWQCQKWTSYCDATTHKCTAS